MVVDNYTFRGLLSPATSAIFTRSDLPSDWSSRGFRILSASVEASAYDAATANKLVIQPTYLQWRIIDPNVLHSSSGTDPTDLTLTVSEPMLFGPNPRRRRLPVTANWYPPTYTGKVYALDCLCPQDGWEGGIAYLLKVSVALGREPRAEKCRVNNGTPGVPTANV